MPEQYRDYCTYQVALQCFNRDMSPESAVQEGDIVTLRRDDRHRGVGLKEMYTLLWIPIMCGYDNDLIEMFNLPWTDTNDDNFTVIYEKRRFAIPLETLHERHGAEVSLDLDKARDQTIIYQPFYNVGDEDGLFVTTIPPLIAEGLVWDKHRMQWV